MCALFTATSGAPAVAKANTDAVYGLNVEPDIDLSDLRAILCCRLYSHVPELCSSSVVSAEVQRLLVLSFFVSTPAGGLCCVWFM
jgi:hypothetical protein